MLHLDDPGELKTDTAKFEYWYRRNKHTLNPMNEFSQSIVAASDQGQYCKEFDHGAIKCPLLQALAEMSGVCDHTDHLEWAYRFPASLMLPVMRNAPNLSGVWGSMVAAL